MPGPRDGSSGEMWVLNEPHEIPEWIGHRRDPDAFADVLNGRLEHGAGARKVLDRFLCIRDAPVRDAPARPGFHTFRIRIQAELKAANVEADVEWLIEIRLDAEG